MKILFVCNSFPELSETFIVTQICGLLDRGYDVRILTTKIVDKPHHQTVEQYGLMERTFVLTKIPKQQRMLSAVSAFIFKYPRSFRQVIRYAVARKRIGRGFESILFPMANFFREQEFDIIHAHFAPIGAHVAVIKKLGVIRTPILTSFHGYDIHPATAPLKNYDSLIQVGDGYTVNSNFSMNMAKSIGFLEKRITILPCGCPTDKFSYPHKAFNDSLPLRLLFVGRIIEFKAPELLIEICQKLRCRDVEFSCSIIGHGDLFERCRALIEEYGLEGHVNLLGAQTQSVIIEYYRNSDLFVFPGIYDKTGRAETQGVVIQEASAMQLPVICSDAGGTNEGVLDGDSGFVLPHGDVDTFVEKICYFNNNRAELKRMGHNGREYVMRKFDNDIIVGNLTTLYDNLLK